MMWFKLEYYATTTTHTCADIRLNFYVTLGQYRGFLYNSREFTPSHYKNNNNSMNLNSTCPWWDVKIRFYSWKHTSNKYKRKLKQVHGTHKK